MNYIWVISVEDDLFLDYQHRKCVIFKLPALKMTCFRVIMLEDDLFVGYQRRELFILWGYGTLAAWGDEGGG